MRVQILKLLEYDHHELLLFFPKDSECYSQFCPTVPRKGVAVAQNSVGIQ